MSKLNVVVLFGGCSEEHDISIKSAMEVAKNLDKEKYNPIYVGITKKGQWRLCKEVSKNWEEEDNPCAVLTPDPSVKGLLLLDGGKYKVIPVDVIFPVIHGKMGEDGTLQGILQLSKIPFVGCELEASLLGMDKSLCHLVADSVGVKVPKHKVIQSLEEIHNCNLEYPVFVKPARSGSSFGVNKVEQESELENAVKEALEFDTKILIEEAIIGDEVGCAVLGNEGNLMTGEVDEIKVESGFFRIHQEKNPEQGSCNSTIKVPADIDYGLQNKVKETAKKVYQALGCRGLTRVDLFLTNKGDVVLNEVNTMPGFTSYSRYPRMMKAAGYSLEEIIDKLIDLAR